MKHDVWMGGQLMSDETTFDMKSLSFLVVEDEAFARDFAAKILERMGAGKTTLSSDGNEALAYLARIIHDASRI